MVDATLPVINMETGVYRDVSAKNPNWQKWMNDALALYQKYGVSYAWYNFDPDNSGSTVMSMLSADKASLTQVGQIASSYYSINPPVNPPSSPPAAPPSPADGLFVDGFESGSSSAWTGSSLWTNDALGVVSTNANSGSYSAQATLAGSGGQNSYYYKNLAASYSTLYYRVYFRISNVGTGSGNAFASEGCYVSCLGLQSGTDYLALAGLYRKNGVVQWYVQYRNGGVWQYSYSTASSPSANVWYSVELKQITGSAAGEVRLYVNGVEVVTVTGLANSDRGSPNRVIAFGQHVNSNPVTVWVDDVATSTTRNN